MRKEAYFKHISIQDSATDWQNAIRLSAKPLVDSGCATEGYVESMIKNVLINGSYIVIMPHVALPHTRAEEGALATGISIMKLIKPVMFPNDKEVSLIIAFSANDNTKHMELLSILGNVLVDEEKLNKILECRKLEQLKKLFA